MILDWEDSDPERIWDADELSDAEKEFCPDSDPTLPEAAFAMGSESDGSEWDLDAADADFFPEDVLIGGKLTLIFAIPATG